MQVAFYKATQSGLPGVYNRLVRWWTRGTYSHCELVFSDGMSASSSFMDKGVRLKRITYDSNSWDILTVPDYLEPEARTWFEVHAGEVYDLRGNLHLVIGPVSESKSKWYCNEAVGTALGITEAWRFSPNSFYQVVEILSKISNRINKNT